ncbi:MAG: hypothetical protein LBD58_02980 [Treponema sp.]|jgi:5'-deoxynucleotidase YfbR-like HD superfamily hydrolase|nr:hypothetical protein [Treponema sp.]
MSEEENHEKPEGQVSHFVELTTSPWFAYAKVRRFHVLNPVHQITDGEHTARIQGMIHFLRHWFPKELFLETVKNELYYASLHDVDEVVVGDIPGYIKPRLKNIDEVARELLTDPEWYGLDPDKPQDTVDDILKAKEKTVLLEVLDPLDALIFLHDEWFTTHDHAVYLNIKDFAGSWYDDLTDKVSCEMPEIAQFLRKLRDEIIQKVDDAVKVLALPCDL